MRNLIVILYVFLSAIPALASDFSGIWNGRYHNSLGDSGIVTCILSQSGVTVTGIIPGGNQPAIFQGTARNDSLLFTINPPSGAKTSNVSGGAAVRNDSATFWYSYKLYFGDSATNGKWDSIITVNGSGLAVREKGTRTLIVDVSYSGTTVIDTTHPIMVYILNVPVSFPDQSTGPLMGLPVYSKSGTATFPLPDSTIVYVVACAGIDPSFNPNRLLVNTTFSYGVYGTQTGGTPIFLDSAATKNIAISFGDERTVTFPAYYPGGLLEYKGSYLQGFGFSPYWENHAIAADTIDDLYLLDSLSRIHHYSQTFTARGIMTTKNGDTVKARDIKVTPSGDFYALLSVAGGHILKRVYGHNSADDTTIVLKGTGFYSRFTVGKLKSIITWDINSNKIEKYDSTGTLLVSRDSTHVRADWNHTGTIMSITSIATDKNGKIYVGIDSWTTNSDPGYDAIIVYDSLLNPIRTIWQSYEIDGPFGLDIDKDGYIYAISHWRDIVMVFDSSGNRYSATWWDVEPGIDGGRMYKPVDVAYGKNALFVAESGNQRVSVYSKRSSTVAVRDLLQHEQISLKTQHGSTMILRRVGADLMVAQISLNKPSFKTKIVVFDLEGRLLHTVDLGYLPKGSHDIRFTAGKVARGMLVAKMILENCATREETFLK